MTEVTRWLLNWFNQRGPVSGSSVEQLWVNYFDVGLIDSLGVIELIGAVEEHFGIHFSQEHFQDRRFSTIGGLSDVTRELLESKEK